MGLFDRLRTAAAAALRSVAERVAPPVPEPFEERTAERLERLEERRAPLERLEELEPLERLEVRRPRIVLPPLEVVLEAEREAQRERARVELERVSALERARELEARAAEARAEAETLEELERAAAEAVALASLEAAEAEADRMRSAAETWKAEALEAEPGELEELLESAAAEAEDRALEAEAVAEGLLERQEQKERVHWWDRRRVREDRASTGETVTLRKGDVVIGPRGGRVEIKADEVIPAAVLAADPFDDVGRPADPAWTYKNGSQDYAPRGVEIRTMNGGERDLRGDLATVSAKLAAIATSRGFVGPVRGLAATMQIMDAAGNVSTFALPVSVDVNGDAAAVLEYARARLGFPGVQVPIGRLPARVWIHGIWYDWSRTGRAA